ncbi:MAG: endonuclease/exonuclease/phosphatase family protein [Paludibacterium sp.]|uniref:endonuclease/exonuclease/phosphatase family protein n=1 Tax=Paludibacterium sp. TaxID=1917523 RepID=UPI0025D676D8|nr:endonuclease/exonuclease/phosphatase family protein [Paludibacterium sp.]MBV8048302.1 endonuclease/exonuclease/phosphatase family protein [Paludibacterium sp.]
MPYYKGVIDDLIAAGHAEDARGVAGKLLSLRNRLSKQIPARNVLSSVLIATWNIREFGADAKFGRRLDESLLYIAEIISHFDLVAVQEVNENLANLQRLIRLLGGWWDYLVTDVTLGASGNSERIAFIYDGRKVRFDRLAGELALPAVKNKPVVQPARSPFICAFRVGWRRVALCSVHIFYGQSKPNDSRRVEEIRAISAALARRNQDRQNISDGEPESVVLLGDFNIFDATKDDTSKALATNDFVVPEALRLPAGKRAVAGGDSVDGRASNLARDKHFDQIAFHDPKGLLKASKGGVFDFQEVVYGPDDAHAHLGAMRRSIPDKVRDIDDEAKLAKLYRQWRTFQLSDHLPLWVELQTDFADNYLASVLHGHKPSRSSTSQRKAAIAAPKAKLNATPARKMRKNPV